MFAARPYPDIGTCEHLVRVTCLPEAKIQVSCEPLSGWGIATQPASGVGPQLLLPGYPASGFCSSCTWWGRGIGARRDPFFFLYQVWFQNRRAKRIKNRKPGGLSPRPEPPHRSHSLPDTPPQPQEPRTLGWLPLPGSAPRCTSGRQHACCPAPGLGPRVGVQAAVPLGSAGAAGAPLSSEQATPQTSLGGLSDLIYASAVVTNTDHS